MISDLEMSVHVNLKEFLRGRSVSFEVDVRSIGLQLRVSSRAVLLDRTQGLIIYDAINSCLECESFFKGPIL